MLTGLDWQRPVPGVELALPASGLIKILQTKLEDPFKFKNTLALKTTKTTRSTLSINVLYLCVNYKAHDEFSCSHIDALVRMSYNLSLEEECPTHAPTLSDSVSGAAGHRHAC